VRSVAIAALLTTICAAPSLVWLNTPSAAQQRTFQPPTATEVFDLRSRCAALGEKLLKDNFTSGSQLSHYNPTTNRCYVELTAGSALLGRSLYDGQTKELLAYTINNNGHRSGEIHDRQHQTTRPEQNFGWDNATAYIDKMMAEDR
jgi:hypothetical protein